MTRAAAQQSSLKEFWGNKSKESNQSQVELAGPATPDLNTMSNENDTAGAQKRKVRPLALGENVSELKKRKTADVLCDGNPGDDDGNRYMEFAVSIAEKAIIAETKAPVLDSDTNYSEANDSDNEWNNSDDDDVQADKLNKSDFRVAHDVDVEEWEKGKPVPFSALAKTFSMIEATTKRIEKTAILTAFFSLVLQRRAEGDSESLLQSVYLCINRLSPEYIGLELGVGEGLLVKAISESTGRSLAMVKADFKKEGDLGLVAVHSKANQKTLFKPKNLTIPYVFTNLKDIALSVGQSSQNKKVALITKLLAACRGLEAKYIIRSLEGKLRIGNAERTVLVALAHAFVLNYSMKESGRSSKDFLADRLVEGASILKSVYSEIPSYEIVIPALLEAGLYRLRDKCKLTPGVPVKPMLAKPTKAIGEVLDRFEGQTFTCEYKYDGERAQVHMLEDGTFMVFSRNSENMSDKYPDLVQQLAHCILPDTQSFVIDAEAVAIDKTTGKLLPFQELSKRKRKDVKLTDIQISVSLFAFDLLYLNGQPLLQHVLSERRILLRKHFKPVPREFDFARSSDGNTIEEIQNFLEESVKDGCEGLMVKMLEEEPSYYEPSRRSINWLKIKKDYLSGVGDSLDLVVVGGYCGKGKRTNFYGAFLLACYDSESEEYQTICKIGTGFSDEALQSHYNALKPLECPTARGDISIGGAKPDAWFEPRIVWEILTADLSLSPIYTAAKGLVDERGISLRFPRFIRVRDDKSPEDATGPEQIAEMYERQTLTAADPSKKRKTADEDNFW